MPSAVDNDIVSAGRIGEKSESLVHRPGDHVLTKKRCQTGLRRPHHPQSAPTGNQEELQTGLHVQATKVASTFTRYTWSPTSSANEGTRRGYLADTAMRHAERLLVNCDT